MIRMMTFAMLMGLSLILQAEPITYQGQLEQSGSTFSGNANLDFRLFDAASDGNQIGATQRMSNVSVNNGQFQVELDFGAGAFDGGARYIEVAVDDTVLSPRQRITASPVALFALSGSGTGSGFWTPGNGGIGYLDGAVGIGTASPQSDLQVIGSILSGNPTNLLSGRNAFVSGGDVLSGDDLPNNAAAVTSFIGGGARQTIPESGARSAILGGSMHTVAGIQSAIVAGNSATIEEPAMRSTILGGFRNIISGGQDLAMLGGANNEMFGQRSIVTGGQNNRLLNTNDGLIAGGKGHRITSSDWSFIGGGSDNTIDSGFGNFIAGGRNNQISGSYAFIGAGSNNFAEGLNSFAAGNRARAESEGSFVWADNSNEDFSTSGNNQFMVRANGGFGINTAPQDAALTIRAASQASNLLDVQVVLGSEPFSALKVNNFGFVSVALSSTRSQQPICWNSNDGTLTQCEVAISSSSLKTNVSELDGQAGIIDQLRPVSFDWKDTGASDIGLIAEEAAQVIPEIVRFDREGTVQGIHYQKLTPILLAGFQEQTAINTERFAMLEQDYQRLVTENAELRAEVAVLKIQTSQMREMAEHNIKLEQRLAALESVLLEGGQMADRTTR